MLAARDREVPNRKPDGGSEKYFRRIVADEDAAHALPRTYDGKMIGSLESDATVFSFYATKTLATGEAG